MVTLDIVNQVDRLQDEISRVFSDRPWTGSGAAVTPALNVWTGEDELLVTAELPGIDPHQLDVQVHGNELTLRGSYPEPELTEGQQWIRQERPAGAFLRSLRLPFSVEPGKVDATYSNGVLALKLPRAEAEKPKRIQIKTAA
jgi:HSP20 family protein